MRSTRLAQEGLILSVFRDFRDGGEIAGSQQLAPTAATRHVLQD